MTHYTSIEQSKHLVELGLPAETADMHYSMLFNRAIDGGGKNLSDFPNTLKPIGIEDIPCWSLEALLDAMPKEITDEYDSKGSLGMCVCYNSSWEWVVYYSNADADCSSIHEEQGNTLLEAAYNMVYWLLEQGYIKKEA